MRTLIIESRKECKICTRVICQSGTYVEIDNGRKVWLCRKCVLTSKHHLAKMNQRKIGVDCSFACFHNRPKNGCIINESTV